MLQSLGYFKYYTKAERNAKIRGIDISRWQYTSAASNPPNFYNFAMAFAAGARFIIMKASGGSTGLTVDPQFTAAHVDAARAAGLKVGFYHYTKPSMSGYNAAGANAEADFFITTCQAMAGNMGDLIPWIDFEDPSLVTLNTNDAAYDWINTFRLRIKELTGRACGVYSGFYYVDNLTAVANKELVHSTKGAISNVMPLWIAAHAQDEYALGIAGGGNSAASPLYPSYNFTKFGGYNDWTVWQYKSDLPDIREGYTFGSASNDLDFDVLEGSLDTIMPPRTPTGISVITTDGEARLSWDANTDTDLVKYNVYQDNIKVGEVVKPETTITLPIQNYREYTFEISASDLYEEGKRSVPVYGYSKVNDRIGTIEPQFINILEGNPKFSDAKPSGDNFYNADEATTLIVKNNGSIPITITLVSQRKCSFGDFHDISMVVPAGKTRIIGGLNRERFNSERGVVRVAYSSTVNVKIAAVKFE